MSTAVSSFAWCAVCGHVHSERPGAQPCALVVDGADAGPLQTTASQVTAGVSPLKVRELGHWAWVPASFCLALMWALPSWSLRLPLVALATLCVAGGYAAGRLIERGRRRDRGHARLSDATRQRAIRFLPGVYASVVVCCHVYVTVMVGLSNGLPDLRAGQPSAGAIASLRSAGPPLRRASEAATRISAGVLVFRVNSCLAANAIDVVPCGGVGTVPARASRRASIASFNSR